MTRQAIGIGSASNDGTGDPLRTAFGKVNDNFTELYDAAPSDTAYASSWDGVTTIPPSKNAVYDKFERLIHPGWKSANWYYPLLFGSLSVGSVIGLNALRYNAIYIPRQVTISDLGCIITTASAGNNLKLAIYAHDPTTNRPSGLPLAETGNISTTSTGAVSADITGANVTLEAGMYWAAFWADNTAVIVASIDRNNPNLGGMLVGAANQTAILTTTPYGDFGLSSTETYGTWPNATSESFSEQIDNRQTRILMFKAA